MSGFSGFVALEGTFIDALQVTDTDHQPVVADAPPTFRIFGPNGQLAGAGGTVADAHIGTLTNATNTTPIVCTCVAHGLQTGQRVTIAGVVGNTAANATAIVTRINADSFSVPQAGNGAYVSGGSFKVVGFFKATISCTGGNGFEIGEHYDIHYSWTVGAATRAAIHSLNVV